MREREDLDLLLDSALATYADEGADAGLEGRVLVRLAEVRLSEEVAPAPLRRRWLLWAVALPVAPCLLLIFTINRTQQPQPKLRSQAHELTSPQVNPTQTIPRAMQHYRQANNAQAAAVRRRAELVAPNAPSRPKLDVFPAPRPLDSQEQVLVALETPDAGTPREVVLDAQQNKSALISIAEIRIPLLETPEEGTN